MARAPISDDACDHLVASEDPLDMVRLRDGAVVSLSLRLGEELFAERDAVLAVARPADGIRWWGRSASQRRLGVVIGCAAVVVVGMLALVGKLPAGGGQVGPLEVPAASAAGVLDLAAQAASRSVSVTPGNGEYGFVRVKEGRVIGSTGPVVGTRPASWWVWVRMSDVRSDWYGSNGSGRERTVRTSTTFLTRRGRRVAAMHGMTLRGLSVGAPYLVDGAFPARTLQTAGVLPYWQLSRLPTQPGALRGALERLLLASAGNQNKGSLAREMRRDPAGLFAPISQFLFVPTSPRLRAAMFRVLASLPGVRLLGHRRDRLGRKGIAVAVTEGGPERVSEELLFDPATGNVLQTESVLVKNAPSTAPDGRRVPTMPVGTVMQYTDFLRRGVVDSITRLPSGRRLPLKATSGH